MNLTEWREHRSMVWYKSGRQNRKWGWLRCAWQTIKGLHYATLARLKNV